MLWQALGSASGEGQKEGVGLRLKPGKAQHLPGLGTASNCTQSFGLAWFVFYIVVFFFLTMLITGLSHSRLVQGAKQK